MTDKQPEALRLAESISQMDTFTEHQRSEIQKAAALLRRQDELLRQALEFCEFAWRDIGMNDYAFDKLDAVLMELRAHLEGEKHETE